MARIGTSRIRLLVLILGGGAVIAGAVPLARRLGAERDLWHEQIDVALVAPVKPPRAPKPKPDPVVEAILQRREREAKEAEKAQVERVEAAMAQLVALDAPTRDKGELILRNLPLEAYPVVEAVYTQRRDSLDPEAAVRLADCVEMFRTLSVNARGRRIVNEWLQRATLEAYQSAGSRSEKWDADARELLVLAFEEWTEERLAKLMELEKKVKAAGCNDPFIEYIQAFLYQKTFDADTKKVGELMEGALDAMNHSGYPPVLKCLATAKCAKFAVATRRRDRERTASELSAAIKHFGEIEPEDAVPASVLFSMADLSYPAGKEDWDWEMSEFQEIYKRLERLTPGSIGLDLFKGAAYSNRAFDQPPLKVKKDPAFDPQKRTKEHLAIAEASFNKVLAAEPDNRRAVIEMLRLCLRAEKERDETEKWFKRAMELDPDSQEACRLKWQMLDSQEWLAFGRELVGRRNLRGRLSFLLVDMHADLAEGAKEKNDYWLGPDVWEDVKSVYEPYLMVFPNDRRIRNFYAKWATKCEKWEVAQRQFDVIGEMLSQEVFGGKATYDYLRKKTARKLAESK